MLRDMPITLLHLKSLYPAIPPLLPFDISILQPRISGLCSYLSFSTDCQGFGWILDKWTVFSLTPDVLIVSHTGHILGVYFWPPCWRFSHFFVIFVGVHISFFVITGVRWAIFFRANVLTPFSIMIGYDLGTTFMSYCFLTVLIGALLGWGSLLWSASLYLLCYNNHLVYTLDLPSVLVLDEKKLISDFTTVL